jgi:hypothetical protein
MSTMGANISQTTYDRLVKRSGVVDLDTLQCDWLLDATGVLHRSFTNAGVAFVQDVTIDVTGMELSSSAGSITGSGRASIGVTLTAIADKERCSTTFRRTETMEVAEGSRDGEYLVLRLAILESTEPVTVKCKNIVLPAFAGTSANIWPEVLGEIRLPAAGGKKSAQESRSIGPLVDTSTAEFTLTANRIGP